jgi:hypothetical protein
VTVLGVAAVLLFAAKTLSGLPSTLKPGKEGEDVGRVSVHQQKPQQRLEQPEELGLVAERGQNLPLTNREHRCVDSVRS